MDIENVRTRFSLLAGLEESEIPKWQTLVSDACAYIETRCRVNNPDSAQTARLELLAADYALNLYDLCSGEKLSQFVAGDVRLGFDRSGNNGNNGAGLWDRLIAESGDLIDCDGFTFRVIE